MFWPTTRTLSVAAVTICFLSGCSKTEPPKAETPRDAPEYQAASNMPGQTQTGEELFKRFCFNCHPDGGNVTDPERTLHGSALRKNHITKPEDIIRIMRKPASRMIRFDPETIPDKEAHIIAEYVLATFR